MNIVCDTNVLISGILFGGNARQIMQMSSRGGLTNYISEEILIEAEDVLSRPKFKLSRQQVHAIIALFRDTFELVEPTIRHRIVRSDPDDDRIIDAAVKARAEVIVSGDKHLLCLETCQGIRILSPAELVQEIEGPFATPST